MSSWTRVLPASFRFSRKLRIRSLLLAVTLAPCVLGAAGASPSLIWSTSGWLGAFVVIGVGPQV
jgi:hypothetical protein